MPDKASFVAWVAVLLLTPISVAAEKGSMAIADFGATIQTEHGGFFRCFGGRPDQIVDRLLSLGEPKIDAWHIRLTSEAPATGVGALVPLFNERFVRQDDLLEIGRGKELCVRLLGSLGQRQARVEIVSGANPEAAGATIGTINSDQIDPRNWRGLRFAVPRDFAGAERAGFVRIAVEGNGPAWIAIDWLAMTTSATTAVTAKTAKAHPLRKALWFWKTEKTLPDSRRTAALLELCHAEGITDLFCQVPHSYENGEIVLRLANEQRAFNAAANELGITTHALNGDPEVVFPKNHASVIRLMEALGELNEQSRPNERYRAVHLDNEPYVLPGWQHDDERREIIRGYIDLNRKLRQKADELGMEFGVDIPFWWDDRDRDGEARFTYDTEAGRQPLLEALFPLVHNIGIMSYRKRVTGHNGVVFHCLNEFELGEKHGVDVFAAMEIGTGNDVEKGTTFGAYPWRYFRGQLSTLEHILSHTPGCAGMAIHYAEPFAEAMK